MLKMMKFLMLLCSVGLIGLAWGMLTTANARLASERAYTTARARNYVKYGFYDRAIPVFYDVLELTTGRDANILYELASVYYKTNNFQSYRRIIQQLIDAKTPPDGMILADLYLEAFTYDRQSRPQGDVIRLLRRGLNNTGDNRLFELYEEHRYALAVRRDIFSEAGVITGNAGLVEQNGVWGFVNGRGNMLLSPRYELATNFSGNYAVVQRNGVLEMINRRGVRQGLADFTAQSIKYFTGTSFVLLPDEEDDYVIASRPAGELHIRRGTSGFEYIGRSNDGLRALKQNGLWAIDDHSNRSSSIDSDFIYQSIAIDELGRIAVNGRLFVNQNGSYTMIDYAGNPIGTPFDEARPFFEEGGLAAVRRGDKWGLVNANGDMVIDFTFDEARSSGFAFAPVRVGELWGYITLENYQQEHRERFFGRMVIEPQFLDAKQFVNGCAPVRGTNGWFYIVLVEYE
jgi:hypothetical protein